MNARANNTEAIKTEIALIKQQLNNLQPKVDKPDYERTELELMVERLQVVIERYKWEEKSTAILKEVDKHVDILKRLNGELVKAKEEPKSREGVDTVRKGYTAQIIKSIRSSRMKNETLAELYGCSKANISLIRNRRTYKWVR